MKLVCLASVVLAILAGCTSDDEAEPPARILALTSAGDVVVINRVAAARETTLAAFRQTKDEETGITYDRADDLTALPGGRVLVSVCCEPAAGVIDVLDESGKRVGVVYGWDPQVDPAGTRVAVAGILGIDIHEASALSTPPDRTIAEQASDFLEDPAWSPDGEELAFTTDGRLAVLPATADTIAEADVLEPGRGTYWASPAYTTDAVVAVEQTGTWRDIYRSGSSRLLSVDLATGERVELASSTGPIKDVTVDASGRYLLWVEEAGLRWRIGDVTSGFAGDFVAAAWIPEETG